MRIQLNILRELLKKNIFWFILFILIVHLNLNLFIDN